MTYWAISDVSDRDLDGFVQLFEEQSPLVSLIRRHGWLESSSFWPIYKALIAGASNSTVSAPREKLPAGRDSIAVVYRRHRNYIFDLWS